MATDIEKVLDLIAEFNEKHNVDIRGQGLQLSAEEGELAEEINKLDREGMKEEIGDVLFVAHSIAQLEDIDAHEALREVTEENMEKDTSKDGNKVTKS